MFGADVGEIPYLMSASITSERAMMTDDAMVATADDWGRIVRSRMAMRAKS